ncbi:NifB/NifX family molybdenum-iron cluster-binding protein [Myxococcota bacterium]|nr:NifB/NifX family molybdenum-iron cluster-binding protein [Myxococcota bacterium]MBU1509138.1 NifB/NifX family molybdenum-iron cluster-binding protein [Myxococcota bacterium]
MRVALVAWNDRLAPLFDTAVWWMLVDCTVEGREIRRMECLMERTPQEKARRAVELEVDLLLCGAISRPLEVFLQERRIQVRSFLSGGLDELVEACRREVFDQRPFVMPGCRSRCRNRQRNGFLDGDERPRRPGHGQKRRS